MYRYELDDAIKVLRNRIGNTDEDADVEIPWTLAWDVLHLMNSLARQPFAVPTVAPRPQDDEPAPQAAPQQVVPVDAEVWKRVKSQVKFLTWKLNPFGHRRDIYDAHHCMGWLMCAVGDNETAAVVINRLERIVERLDDSVRCAISATEGFDLSEDA